VASQAFDHRDNVTTSVLEVEDDIVVSMFKKPSAAMISTLPDFVFRQDFFVEARQF